MKFFEKVAQLMAPGLMNQEQVKALVKDEVFKARQALPINIDYDPKGEGYRRLSAQGQEQSRRDLSPLSQDLMLELAYYLYDTSGLVKRFVRDTKNFVLGEDISISVKNDSEDGAARQVLDDFWGDSMNQMDIRMEKRIEFLGLLGEQCWPVAVNKHNGRVWVSYVDPTNIEDVLTARDYPEITAAVKLKGTAGRSGKMLPVVREELDIMRKEYGRLVGECFYFSINNPPNGPRGRSDLIHLFDFINAMEEGIFDELDRMKGIKAFIWDVTLNGADDNQIKDFLQNNKAPKSNSVRAHNEQVKWEAVAPKMGQHESKAFFDMMKSYLAACMNRPDSWLGSGGKAYQTEADLMGAPAFKDLGSRQRYVKYMIEYILKFVLDQAIIAGTLREPKGKRFAPVVDMPEVSAKDLKKIVDGLFTLAQSLMIAVSNNWLTDETAGKLFANVATQTGIDIDAAEEVKKAATDPNVTIDYAAREALIDEITGRIEARTGAASGRRLTVVE